MFRRLALAVLVALAGAGGAVLAAADDPAAAPRSGIELVGRSETDRAPKAWTVADAATGNVVAEVHDKWGLAPVPPGKYALRVLPTGYYGVEVPWGEVTVEDGRATRVELASGVELVGRDDADPVLEYWEAVDAQGKPVAHVWQHWGFTPLPPGAYALRLLARGHDALAIPWGDVRVESGRVARVEIRSGIELAGRSADEPVLEHWEVLAADGKPVAHVWQRWGFTPLPPGTYGLRLQPHGHAALGVPWDDVHVESGRVARVELRSGIELVPRAADEPELEHWEAIDPEGKPVAHVWQRWGFTPLRPGTYGLHLQPRGHLARTIPWAPVTVAANEVARVELLTGVELSGRTKDDPPLEYWEVIGRATGEPVAHVWERWGFTPVPPGTYGLRIRSQGSAMSEVAWGEVRVEPGRISVVEIRSGIDLVGRPDRPPGNWDVLDPRTHEVVSHVYHRWGFAPVPPGTYDVLRAPRRWPGVEVKPGEVTVLQEADLATRWAYVSGDGRKTEKERDPQGWKRLEEEVERAIRRAGAWLKKQPPIEKIDLEDYGTATIGILALVHAGELERDPRLAKRCVEYLRRRPLNGSHGTYATALTAMALRDIASLRHRGRIRECAQWLLESQGWEGEQRAWGYNAPMPGFDEPKPEERTGGRGKVAPPAELVRTGAAAWKSGWDNSNAQFAVLGLHAAAQARMTVPRESWQRTEAHFRAVQNSDGSWGYTSGGGTGSMTCAGLASLVLARHYQGAEHAALDPAVLDGLEWLDWKFTVEENPGSQSDHTYFLYGLERVGVLAGTEFFGEHEWYPLGARHLLSFQSADGSWQSPKGGATGSPADYLDTCYAILFLRRATLPLETHAPALISVASDEGELKRDLMPAVELILDASGSMKELVEGKPKILIARAVLTEVLDKLPADVQVGLRLYGHRGIWMMRGNDPRARPLAKDDPRLKRDTELVVEIGPLDDERRMRIRRRIEEAQPVGWTPMVLSLLEARKDFATGEKAPRTVVLVSDGEETGGGKLSDVEEAYRGSGIETKIHVVGFDIAGTEAERQLKEIARMGKGSYYGATNAKELAAALRAAVPSLGFEVRDASDAVVARGPLNGDPIAVKPGTYRVHLVGLPSDPVEVTLEDGDEEALRVDAAGKLLR